MCSLGAEGFREVVVYVFLGRYVLNLDRSSLYVVLREVVFEVNGFLAFGWSRVLGDEDCGLVVYGHGGWLGFQCVGIDEEAAELVCLLCCRPGGQLFGFTRGVGDNGLPGRRPADGGGVEHVYYSCPGVACVVID